MRESLMYGSVRGARGNSRPYRDMVFAAVHESGCVLCAGFRTPATTSYPRAPEAGVRKAPRHEIAGDTLGRPCRWLSYGDLSGERAACERARGER